MKTRHPQAEKMLQSIVALAEESMHAKSNLPKKQMKDEVATIIHEFLDKYPVANGNLPEDIAEDVLGMLLYQRYLVKFLIPVVEDYVDGTRAQKAHEEFLASGEEPISHDELMRKLGIA